MPFPTLKARKHDLQPRVVQLIFNPPQVYFDVTRHQRHIHRSLESGDLRHIGNRSARKGNFSKFYSIQGWSRDLGLGLVAEDRLYQLDGPLTR